ncbi:MAG: tetratricopeptide repeat protein [Myxococcota bacterium]
MRTIRGTLAAFAAAGLLAACGGSSQSVEQDREATAKAEAEAEAAAKAEAEAEEKERERLTDDDFEVQVIEEVEAPTYLPGIDREAQDQFRVGVLAALDSPPRYELAAKKFRTAIDSDPNFMEAYFNLGQTLERMGRRDDALAVYQEALEKNPDNPSATAYIAKIYLGKARHEGLLGNEQESKKWYDEAKGLLDQVIGQASENEAVNNAMALYYLAQDDLDTAEKYVREVLYVEPTNVTALNTRGLINLRRGEYLIAEWIFKNKVLEEDPNSTEALTNLGFTYVKLDKRPLAMKFFDKALAQNPDNMEVRMNIAAMLLEHLNYAKAYEHYTTVREAQPLNIEAHEGQCDAAYGLGGSAEDPPAQFQAAIDCYVALLERKPERVDLYAHIAETYQEKLQDLEKAVAYYEKYVDKADLTPEEEKKVAGTVKVLKDIISEGGMNAMMEPEPEPDEGEGEGEGAEGEGAQGGDEATEAPAEEAPIEEAPATETVEETPTEEGEEAEEPEATPTEAPAEEPETDKATEEAGEQGAAEPVTEGADEAPAEEAVTR